MVRVHHHLSKSRFLLIRIDAVMTIVSSLVGVASLVHFFLRAWVLYRQYDRRGPVGGSRWQLDMFQYLFALCVIGVILELVFGWY